MKKLIAKKIGMSQVYSDQGDLIPVTVLEAGPCVIAQVKTDEKDGYRAVQLGFGKKKKINKPQKGHLKELTPQCLVECRVEKTEGLEVGQIYKADMFKAGEMVNVSGISRGKGFMGTVVRWNFGRGDMTHGSKSHRIPGSIGAGTTPGRVFKGTKMAGQMGNVKVKQRNLLVVSVDPENNIMLVRGAVPGHKNGIVVVHKQ
ncbi:MAG: 50S ribosomal protein L3 [Candidatus Margulisiibacteriota bacterium]|nr:50S ribosomal protein L3 [Candidatus Margulisiibacteriota bacterium]